MTSESNAQDAPAVAPVQVLPAPAQEERAQLARLAAFFTPLQSAMEANDVAGLQAVVPGLTKKEAATLIFHTRRMAQGRAADDGGLILRYARETWGTKPPHTILSGTFKVRVPGLRAQFPGLSVSDAGALVSERMVEELTELSDAERGSYRFWRFPIDVPNSADYRAAGALLRQREQARLAALLSYYDAPLREAHEAARQVLEASGLPFELLAEWHKRSEQPAA